MISTKHFSSLALTLLVAFTIFSSAIFAQTSPQLSQEFLEGLPPSVRDQIEVQNSVEEETKLEDLFRSDTSLEKNKVILNKLKDQLKALEQQIDGDKLTGIGDLTRYGDVFFQSLQSSFMPINVPNLNGNYLVDVGDQFKLLLTGKISEEIELEIGRDGSLPIPEFGKVYVAGKSLSDAEDLVSAYIDMKTVGVSSYLSLSKVRDIQVLMLGGIESPGIFTISGGSSVLSALNVAGGISDNGSYRKIDVKRNGKVIETVDLYDIFVFGKFNSTSTLRSGDTIFVHPSSFIIPVSGGVNYEALFEIMPEETAGSAIEFAGGFSEGFYGFKSISIDSVDLSGTKNTIIALKELQNFKLNPRDSLIVPSFVNQPKPAQQVIIEGMVHRPGKYNIREGEKLSEVIERAGGYKDDAYTFGGALFRQSALDKEKIFAQLNYSDTVNYIVSNIGKPNRSVDSSALDLLGEELRSQNFTGRLIANFDVSSFGSDASSDIQLANKDRIVIPALQKIVYLFGDFKNPSNIAFKSSFSAKDYIKLVGGLKDSAFNELLVIDPDGTTHLFNSKTLLFAKSVDIYPGTIIYAPRDIGKLSGVLYASSVSPILSSLALSLASLNSISN